MDHEKFTILLIFGTFSFGGCGGQGSYFWPNQRVIGQIHTTQNSQATFKQNLTCIFLSARARYIRSNPDRKPCNYYHDIIVIDSSRFYKEQKSISARCLLPIRRSKILGSDWMTDFIQPFWDLRKLIFCQNVLLLNFDTISKFNCVFNFQVKCSYFSAVTTRLCLTRSSGFHRIYSHPY